MDSRKNTEFRRMPALATALIVVGSLWYAALALNRLCDVQRIAGLPFVWTAILGLVPFVSLAIAGLLVEGYRKSRGISRELYVISLAIGLSPWLWLVVSPR